MNAFKRWVGVACLFAGLSPWIHSRLHAADEGVGVRPALDATAGLKDDSNRMSAGFGVSYFDSDYSKLYGMGQVGPSVNAGFMKQIAKAPIYAGVDFGISFYNFGSSAANGVETDRSAYGIQLLPSILYRLRFPTHPELSPYLGFSMGPHLLIRKDRTLNRNEGVIDSNPTTYAYFQFLARPGIDFVIAEGIAINLESKFGILGASFNWLPQANIVLLL